MAEFSCQKLEWQDPQTQTHTHTHTHKHKQLPNNNEMSTFLVAFAKLAKSDY
jgi:hypothetical protein